MKQRKLGCLSSGGLITLLISLFVVGISYAVSGNKMFSPGALNSQQSSRVIGGVFSHTELEQDCDACHPAPWDTDNMSDLCLACHQDVSDQIPDTTTLHGAAMAEMSNEDCRVCHTDHNGPDMSMTDFIEGDFPHQLVRFDLKSHQGIDWIRDIVCADCHLNGYTDFDVFACIDCHVQIDKPFMVEHSSLFKNACLECHDGIETLGSEFDHDIQPFALIGRHEVLRCDDCHREAETVTMLKDTPIECESCHLEDDAHQGYLGYLCGSCHSPEGWKPALYNHETTGFELISGHDNLTCEKCHPDPTYQGLNSDCISCHLEDEPHVGQYGTDCTICHTIAEWGEIIFDHSEPYTQDCESCHLPDSPLYHYPGQCSICHLTSAWRPASFDHTGGGATDCLTCHSSDRPSNHYPGQCSVCHYTNVWKPANFNHTFPLNHHGAQKRCQLCHPSSNYYAYTCYQCHEHSKSEIRKEHEGVSNLANCVRCHKDGRKHDD